jgi:hypothetical protein
MAMFAQHARCVTSDVACTADHENSHKVIHLEKYPIQFKKIQIPGSFSSRQARLRTARNDKTNAFIGASEIAPFPLTNSLSDYYEPVKLCRIKDRSTT